MRVGSSRFLPTAGSYSGSYSWKKIGFTALSLACGLAIAGCHNNSEDDFSKPIQLPQQNAAASSPQQAGASANPSAPHASSPASASPADKNGASSVVSNDPPLQHGADDNEAPPVSAQSSHADGAAKPLSSAAAPKTAPPVSLKSLPMPKIDPKAPVALEPGITIGEPTPDRNDAPLTAFGAGCARWLNYAVGGLPEMGRTPTWFSATRFETRANRANYQLAPADAPALYNILGVTYAASGQITGDASHCVLTYQVFSVPDGKPVGGPLTLSGTQDQIAAGLPQLGRQIAQAVGVHNPADLSAIGANGNDLAALGGLPWTDEEGLTPQQTQTARDLAPRLAPAGIVLLLTNHFMEDTNAARQIAQTLLQQGKDNGIALSELAIVAQLMPREIAKAVSRNAARYPNNYLAMGASARWARVVGDRRVEFNAITRATRISPHNVNAWLGQATTLEHIANDIRYGRGARQLSELEWRQLNSLYIAQAQAARKATEVDPQNGGAWLAAAEAGTFSGGKMWAEECYWKAVELDKSDPDVHAWGLQMFQEKWGGSPSDLQKVADIAVDAPLKTMAARRRIAWDLKEAGCQSQATTMYARMKDEEQVTVAREPNNAQAHFDLAACYEALHLDALATREYKTVVALRPGDARAHFDLAEHLVRRGRYRDGVKEYQEARRLAPNWGHAHLRLVWALKEDRQMAEAEKQLRQTLAYPLTDLDEANVHFGLAKIMLEAKRFPESAKELKSTIALSPMSAEGYSLLCGVLAEMKQFKPSIAAGLKALQLNPYDEAAHVSLSYAYGELNQQELSAEQCRIALRLNPNDPTPHLNLAEALYKMGQKEEARAEWQTTLRLSPTGPCANDARQGLMKK